VQGANTTRATRLDLLLYLVCAVFAATTALWSEFYGYRVWGNFATVAYLVAAVHAAWLLVGARRDHTHAGVAAAPAMTALRSRWTPIAVIGAVGMAVPLGVLVIRRLTGVDWLITPVSWAAQPEVWVIERSAELLLRTGSPYLDIAALGRPPEVNDYTPYGPAMTVFGLPRAIFGGTPVGDALTDARLIFAITAVATVVLSLRLIGWPQLPVRAAQLAVVSPLTALTWAVAGPDLAITGVLILAGALLMPTRPGADTASATSRNQAPYWSATVAAVAVSMKLTALPAVVVLAFLVWATLGGRTLRRYVAVFTAGCLALNLPALIIAPAAFTENVISFPIGLGAISSPAGSALPGHLIASAGPIGHIISLVLLGIAAMIILSWLVFRPPTVGSDAMFRIAIGLGAATMLMPASRWGYLVYPLALAGAMLCFSAAERMHRPAVDKHPALR
jgi:hypothetical protein